MKKLYIRYLFFLTLYNFTRVDLSLYLYIKYSNVNLDFINLSAISRNFPDNPCSSRLCSPQRMQRMTKRLNGIYKMKPTQVKRNVPVNVFHHREITLTRNDHFCRYVGKISRK